MTKEHPLASPEARRELIAPIEITAEERKLGIQPKKLAAVASINRNLALFRDSGNVVFLCRAKLDADQFEIELGDIWNKYMDYLINAVAGEMEIFSKLDSEEIADIVCPVRPEKGQRSLLSWAKISEKKEQIYDRVMQVYLKIGDSSDRDLKISQIYEKVAEEFEVDPRHVQRVYSELEEIYKDMGFPRPPGR
ncbi:MAG: hypothetical protein B7Z80_04025 [Rhodospirillales bacterium 20-64-7]|nr:MAG: hypothetical protein B7Z80_04025 [Rhodospirillales bacterium 20-64-7]